MSNSNLLDYTCISPNSTNPRNHVIDTVTIHCVVGQVTVERLGEIFASNSRNASSNYGVGYDGRIGMYCEEKNRSWCSSSKTNDNRAITIEVASDTVTPYYVTDAVMSSLIKLLADICKRNNIKELLWQGNKSLIGQVDKQNMTVHRWFANKSCPGDYLYNKHNYIATEVNKLLNGDINMKYEIATKTTCNTLEEKNVMLELLNGLGLECKVTEIEEEVIQENPYEKPTRNLMLKSPLMNGKDVKWLQWELAQSDYYFMDIDGYFGNGTNKALLLYQEEYNLVVDGICGNNTINSLLKY